MMNRSVSEMDWSLVPDFTKEEFKNVDLTKLSEDMLCTLQIFRDVLGRPVFPSPLSEAWVRIDGSKTSRHYAVGRLSNAGDVFPACHVTEGLLAALRAGFGGIGIYLDTHYDGKPMVMLHLDLRPIENQAIWLRETIEGENGKPKQVYTTYYQPSKGLDDLRELFNKLSQVEI